MQLPIMTRDVYCFACPLCSESIALPRQNHLGKYVDLRYQPSGEWPITLLCSRYARLSEVPPESIRLETRVALGPISGPMVLWRIESECAHENCGANYAIYTTSYADESTEGVMRFLSDANPVIDCVGDHRLEFSLDRMKAEKLEFR
jgi:hypothetical protein